MNGCCSEFPPKRGKMAKGQTNSARSWALMPLTGMCVVIALITSGSALAADRDDDGGRRCRGLSSEAGMDPLGFPQPEVRGSHGGVLRTALHACVSTNEMLDQNAQPPQIVEIHPPTFEGTIPGPTLKVKPGDKLSILLVNELPSNPTNERDNAFPHDENTLNLHTHGLTVSPLGVSDNIFREMKPGTTNLIQIDIPKVHPSGTYWYQVQKHGSVTYQFLGGMAGFLIIEGGEGTLDTVPEVAAAKDVPMAFQVIRSTNDGKVVFVNEKSQQFSTSAFSPPAPPPPIENQGLWSAY